MARGARERFGADIGVGITGIAGPDGGSDDKPVGLVHFCVSDATSQVARRVVIPGNRADVRQRAVTVAMHLVRRLLADLGSIDHR
jgi:nicotinamide-nucleotide amidase